MAVIRLPSFWDYLGQGVSGAFDTMGELQRRRLLEEQAKRAQTQFDYEVEPLALGRDIRAAEAKPAELFFPNLMSNVGGMTMKVPGKNFTESQYEFAGMKTPAARQKEKSRQAVTDYKSELEIPTLEQKAAEAKAIMPGTGTDVARTRATQMKDQVSQFADAYVAQQILQSNGRMSGTNLATMAANAYGAFTADPSRLGTLGVEGISSGTLRPLFDEAVKAAWDKQRGLDIESLRASAYSAGQVKDNTPQIMNALTNQAKMFEKRAQDIEAQLGNPAGMIVTDEKTGQMRLMNAAEQAKLRENAAAARQLTNQLSAAGNSLAAGTMSVEQASALLNDVAKVLISEAPPPQPGAGAAGEQFDDVSIIAEARKFAPSQWRAKLQREVQLGRMSPAQMTRVLAQLERGR